MMRQDAEDRPRRAALPGLGQWVQPGAQAAAERLFEDAAAAGIGELRVAVTLGGLSDDNAHWLDGLLDHAGAQARITLALYRHGPEHSAALPPAWVRHDLYCEQVDALLARVSGRVACVELADPLGPAAWPDVSSRSQALLSRLPRMTGRDDGALPTRLCLGGLALDAAWLELARRAGLLTGFAALAFACVPASAAAREAALTALHKRPGNDCEIRFTPRRRYSRDPLSVFEQLHDSGADLVFVDPSQPRRSPPTALRNADGKPSLVARLLRSDGRAALAHYASSTHRAGGSRELIIGGAGFIGSNLAARLAAADRDVLILDDLSRPGTERNLDWLRCRFQDRIAFERADVRDARAVAACVARARHIYHLAAQVAVTTSLEQPRHDHDVNTRGTLNVLEAIRACADPPPLLYTSTNKVYGSLPALALTLGPEGYEPTAGHARDDGIDERQPLDFCSPYGCSKGAADQYVLDYARSYGIPAVVFRMSCIYGPRQLGNEDQGWVAHFLRHALQGAPLTVYGDGHQVRDVLYVDDLVEALRVASARLPALAGRAFNIGGGPGNVLSLRTLLAWLENATGAPDITWAPWRSGDQRYYVSDIRAFEAATGWRPRVPVAAGLERLCDWLRAELGVPPQRLANGHAHAEDRTRLHAARHGGIS